jgi:hypothetical protein
MRRILGHDLVKRALLGVALVALLLLPAAAMAQSYVGKYCWTMTILASDSGAPIPFSILTTFDVTHLGGTTYFLTGYALPPGDNPFLVSGTAQAAGSDIYLNLTGSQDHRPYMQWLDSSHINGKLNAATLNGTMSDVGHDRNMITGSYGGHFSSGTLTLTPCP